MASSKRHSTEDLKKSLIKPVEEIPTTEKSGLADTSPVSKPEEAVLRLRKEWSVLGLRTAGELDLVRERGDGDSDSDDSSQLSQVTSLLSLERTDADMSLKIANTGVTTALHQRALIFTIGKAASTDIEVVSSDMPLELREVALEVISRAAANVRTYEQVAQKVKAEMDTIFMDVPWQCAVGHSFGCSVSHQVQFFLFATADTLAVLVFRAV